MANRSITTKVAVEGEQQYTSALKTINAELKTLYSQMELTSSTFRNNANSQSALIAQSSNLTNVAQKEVEKYNTLKQALENARSAQDKWAEKMSTSASKINENTARMSELENRIKANSEAYNQYEQRLQAAKAKMEELKKSTGDTRQEQAQTGSTIMYLEKQMQTLDAAIKTDTQEYEYLNNENKELNETLTSSTNAYNTATNTAEKYETALNKEQVVINQLDDSINKNNQYLKEAKTSTDGCATSIDKFGKEVDESNDDLNGFGDNVTSIGDGFSDLSSVLASLGVEQAIDKITDALLQCSDVAANFEYSMATVEAVSSATDEQLAQLSSQAEEWAGSTIYLAEDIADTYVQMGRAGWDAQDMLDSMSGVMSLAAASGEELTDVTTIVTTALTAFGESASESGHFADVLSETAADSSTNVAQLGEAFKAVGTTAGNLNYSIDDVATVLGSMASQALRGELAGTALSTALTRMSGANANASKEMEALGLSMYDAEGNAKPLLQFMNELRAAFAEFGDDAQAAQVAAYKLAGQRGMKGLMAIVNTSQEDWATLTESIENCAGAADTMADIQLDTYTGEVQLLQSAISILENTIGSALNESLRSIVERATEAVNGINSFIEKNQEAIPIVAGLTAGLLSFAEGTVLAASAVTLFHTAFGAAFLDALGTAATLMGPLAIAIGAVTAAYLLLEDTGESYAETAADVNAQVKEATEAANAEKQSYSETQSAAASAAASNQSLVASLLQLTNAYDHNASSAFEINNIVSQLNENIPGLNLSFNATTGELNMTSEALEAMIEQMSAYDDMSAAIEHRDAMKDVWESQKAAYNEAKAAYEDAKAELDDMNASIEAGEQVDGTIYSNLAGNVADLETAMNAAGDACESSFADYEKAYSGAEDLKSAYDALNPSAEDAADAIDGATDSTAANAEAAEEAAEANAEANESLNKIRVAINKASGSTSELREQYEDLVKEYEKLDGAGNEYLSNLVQQKLEEMNLIITTQEVTEALGDNLTAIGATSSGLAQMLIDAGMDVDEFAELVQDNFDDIANDFEDLDLSEQKSLDDMVTALNNNAQKTYDWQYKIAEAWEMAVQSGDQNAMAFVQNLDDMGIESYDAVCDLVDGGTTALTEAADAWGTAMDTSIKHALLQFAENEGITYADAYAMAQSGTIAINDATGEYETVGSALTDATGTGAEESTAISDAVSAVLEDAIGAGEEDADAFDSVGEAIDDGIASGISGNQSVISTKLKAAIYTAKASINTNQFYSVGYAICTGVASGIYAGSSLVSSAARTMALNAYNSARAELQINSPSKVFRDKIGGGIIEGLVAGINKGIPTVEKASVALADATMFDTDGITRQSVVNTTTSSAGNSNSKNITENFNINIYSQPGQDENKIANNVVRKITSMIARGG